MDSLKLFNICVGRMQAWSLSLNKGGIMQKITNVIKYLEKEIKKYTKLSDKLEYIYENERDGHPVDMYEDETYIEYCVKINYLYELIDKIKERSKK